MTLVRTKPDIAFVFGQFTLIPSRQLLIRNGSRLKLGGRALDILQLLVMRAGEEVSSEELIKFAWPDVFVDKHNLKVHVGSVRRALQDTFPQPTYVATIVGRGYKFVERVHARQLEPDDRSIDCEPIDPGLPPVPVLVGRDREVESIGKLLDEARLVTLLGPGGVGKTCLAVAAAHAKRDLFLDGLYFVDLSSIDDPALVPHLAAAVLGLRSGPADPHMMIALHLRDRRILLVLDNCEHLLPGVGSFAGRVLGSDGQGRLLATSREPLDVRAEATHRVEPLAFPVGAQVRSATEALSYSSIALFALRARDAADYTLVDEEAAVVADVCAALDGLPLAIEIAAAKLGLFSPKELLASVVGRLDELRNDRSPVSRHQTIWATLDWSYRLLGRQEAAIFRLLSVCAGSFEWTDVVGMARLAEIDRYMITSALGGLVEKSMLTVEISGEKISYRLLETVKAYAAERLRSDPLYIEAHERHARLVLTLFEKSGIEWASDETRTWRMRYEPRSGDLRKALDWCFEGGGSASVGVDLAIAATRYWNEQSSMFEQLRQVERALTHCASVPDAPRRKAVLAASQAWCMAFGGRLHAETDDAWSRALRFAELSDDTSQRLSAMCGMSLFLVATGRLDESTRLLDQVIEVATRTDEWASLLDGRRLRAMGEARRGNLLSAQKELRRLAGELARGLPQSTHVRYQLQPYVTIHGMLAFSTWLTGDPGRALAMAREMVERTGENGHLMGQSRILVLFAVPLAWWSGDAKAFERYCGLLGANLDRGHIVMWEHAYRLYAAAGRYARGDAGAVEDMRAAIDDLVRDRFLERTPMYLGMLAEALASESRLDEADRALESGLSMLRQTAENWCLPELLRVKARIVAAGGNRSGAKSLLDMARGHARRFAATSLELRIVNDIAQLAIDGGDEGAACDLLASMHARFADDEATEDLRICSRLLGRVQARSGLGSMDLQRPPVIARPADGGGRSGA